MSEYTQGSGRTSAPLLTVGRHLDMSQITVAIERSLIIIDLVSEFPVTAVDNSPVVCVGALYVVAAHLFNYLTTDRPSVCSFVNIMLSLGSRNCWG
jgi:hypothetical protein